MTPVNSFSCVIEVNVFESNDNYYLLKRESLNIYKFHQHVSKFFKDIYIKDLTFVHYKLIILNINKIKYKKHFT